MLLKISLFQRTQEVECCIAERKSMSNFKIETILKNLLSF